MSKRSGNLQKSVRPFKTRINLRLNDQEKIPSRQFDSVENQQRSRIEKIKVQLNKDKQRLEHQQLLLQQSTGRSDYQQLLGGISPDRSSNQVAQLDSSRLQQLQFSTIQNQIKHQAPSVQHLHARFQEKYDKKKSINQSNSMASIISPTNVPLSLQQKQTPILQEEVSSVSRDILGNHHQPFKRKIKIQNQGSDVGLLNEISKVMLRRENTVQNLQTNFQSPQYQQEEGQQALKSFRLDKSKNKRKGLQSKDLTYEQEIIDQKTHQIQAQGQGHQIQTDEVVDEVQLIQSAENTHREGKSQQKSQVQLNLPIVKQRNYVQGADTISKIQRFRQLNYSKQNSNQNTSNKKAIQISQNIDNGTNSPNQRTVTSQNTNTVTSKLSKRNFEKNLKMANLEIMRLRKEVQEKNSAYENLQKAYEDVIKKKENYNSALNNSRQNKIGWETPASMLSGENYIIDQGSNRNQNHQHVQNDTFTSQVNIHRNNSQSIIDKFTIMNKGLTNVSRGEDESSRLVSGTRKNLQNSSSLSQINSFRVKKFNIGRIGKNDISSPDLGRAVSQPVLMTVKNKFGSANNTVFEPIINQEAYQNQMPSLNLNGGDNNRLYSAATNQMQGDEVFFSQESLIQKSSSIQKNQAQSVQREVIEKEVSQDKFRSRKYKSPNQRHSSGSVNNAVNNGSGSLTLQVQSQQNSISQPQLKQQGVYSTPQSKQNILLTNVGLPKQTPQIGLLSRDLDILEEQSENEEEGGQQTKEGFNKKQSINIFSQKDSQKQVGAKFAQVQKKNVKKQTSTVQDYNSNQSNLKTTAQTNQQWVVENSLQKQNSEENNLASTNKIYSGNMQGFTLSDKNTPYKGSFVILQKDFQMNSKQNSSNKKSCQEEEKQSQKLFNTETNEYLDAEIQETPKLACKIKFDDSLEKLESNNQGTPQRGQIVKPQPQKQIKKQIEVLQQESMSSTSSAKILQKLQQNTKPSTQKTQGLKASNVFIDLEPQKPTIPFADIVQQQQKSTKTPQVQDYKDAPQVYLNTNLDFFATPSKENAKRFQVFYEDDIEDEYEITPNQEPVFYYQEEEAQYFEKQRSDEISDESQKQFIMSTTMQKMNYQQELVTSTPQNLQSMVQSMDNKLEEEEVIQGGKNNLLASQLEIFGGVRTSAAARYNEDQPQINQSQDEDDDVCRYQDSGIIQKDERCSKERKMENIADKMMKQFQKGQQSQQPMISKFNQKTVQQPQSNINGFNNLKQGNQKNNVNSLEEGNGEVFTFDCKAQLKQIEQMRAKETLDAKNKQQLKQKMQGKVQNLKNDFVNELDFKDSFGGCEIVEEQKNLYLLNNK